MRTPVTSPVKKTAALLLALDQHYRAQGLSRRLREAKLARPLYWKPEGGPQSTRRLSESNRPARSPLGVFKTVYGGRPMREDEQGLPNQGDVHELVNHVKDRVGDDAGPLRVTCPACGSKFPMALPDGVSVVPSDADTEEAAAAEDAVTVACPECSREFNVAAPRGHTFRDAEGAAGDIACHDEALKASEALVQHFIRRFRGRPSANDGRTALDLFRESYGTAARDGRLPALPPD